jgi:hypothetical protein
MTHLRLWPSSGTPRSSRHALARQVHPTTTSLDREKGGSSAKTTVDPTGSTWDSEPGQTPIRSTGQLTDDGVHVCRTNVLGHHN